MAGVGVRMWMALQFAEKVKVRPQRLKPDSFCDSYGAASSRALSKQDQKMSLSANVNRHYLNGFELTARRRWRGALFGIDRELVL